MSGTVESTRGILNPSDGLARFQLEREPPPPDLAWLVERFWRVSWDLEGQPPFEQEVLPYPCVNVSRVRGEPFEVHGPGTRRFVKRLSGRGSVLGTKFTPAGFFVVARMPMRALVDQVSTFESALGCTPPPTADDQPDSVRDAMIALLRAQPFDPQVAVVDRLVRHAQEDRGVARSQDLARVAGLSIRSLQRLFERYVGVGPKWIVRRSRVQEAAERVRSGERVDWASTAQELGYHDQAHLIRDFREQVGFTPAAYARRCAAALQRESDSISDAIRSASPS